MTQPTTWQIQYRAALAAAKAAAVTGRKVVKVERPA